MGWAGLWLFLTPRHLLSRTGFSVTPTWLCVGTLCTLILPGTLGVPIHSRVPREGLQSPAVGVFFAHRWGAVKKRQTRGWEPTQTVGGVSRCRVARPVRRDCLPGLLESPEQGWACTASDQNRGGSKFPTV